MASISSNIKKIRRESGLTQAELGKILNVSPQAISSWETGRTQPDLDMLTALSEALGADAEEIIYGKKNKVGLEPEKKKDRRLFVTLLAAVGSLLVAAGLITLLAAVWDKIDSFAPVLGSLPFLAGLGFAWFVQENKKGLVAWREASAVVWTAGFAATIAIYNGIWEGGLELHELLLVDLIGTIPVLLITDGIVPFAFILYAVSHWAGEFSQTRSGYFNPLCALLVVAVVILFCALYTKHTESAVRKKIQSIFVLAGAVFNACLLLWVILGQLAYCELTVIFTLFAITLVAALRPTFAGMSAAKLCTALLSAFNLVFADFIVTGSNNENETAGAVICAAMVLLAVVIGALTGRDYIKKDFVPAATAAFAVIQSVLIIICHIAHLYGHFTVPTLVIALASGVMLVIAGVSRGSLFNANLGMVTGGTVVIFVSIYSEFPLVAKGLTALALGAILLVINHALLKSLEKEEVQTDE